MALTEAEKVAGRRFRAESERYLAGLNTNEPPTFVALHLLGVFRHQCRRRNDNSTAIELKERYLTSPIYPSEEVPAGRFGYIYREGRCLNCGATARSEKGRVVDAYQRPPLTGRSVRS